jgi:1,2-dihydroxy-3-keto-5-methylthiopentene dioxygenase
MAIVKAPHRGRTFIMPAEIQPFLSSIGVEYQRWTRVHPIPADASGEEILKAYEPELEAYKQENNFVGYSFIELHGETPGFADELAELKREHWHNGVESDLILSGCLTCYVHPAGQPVISIELEPGDLISIGKGIRHWGDLCSKIGVRAVRFISRPEEDRKTYTHSGIEADYESVYVSPAAFAAAASRH